MAVDEVEFREFFASQYVRLCWLGLLLTGDRAEAEELAQEALARTWWRWAVHRPDDPAAYARKVLVNRRRSLLRRAGVEARFLARTRPEPAPPPATSGPWSSGRPSRAFRRASGPCWCSGSTRTSPRPRSPASSACPWARSSPLPTAAWPACATGSAPGPRLGRPARKEAR